MEGRKEGNVLFNDTLNTFYLRLYGFRHMVKDLCRWLHKVNVKRSSMYIFSNNSLFFR